MQAHSNKSVSEVTQLESQSIVAVQSTSNLAFSRLGLAAAVTDNLIQLGYLEMTPIQAASLPQALAGKDLIAQAQTGSGKTAAFAIPLLNKIDVASFSPQALILCPTRELADQVTTEIRRLARALGNIKVITLCGGVAARGQRASLEHGAHIVVGTPGRIQDHLTRGFLKFDQLNTLVLDEADRMLDMGFYDDIVAITAQTPAARQTLMFSATYPVSIEKLARRFMRTPVHIKIETAPQENKIDQRFYEVVSAQRFEVVAQLLRHFRPVSCLAFCNTKQQSKDLLAYLQSQQFNVLALNGELEQRDRDQVLVQFANRSCSVLVATDVASRGLDIAQLEAVINVDVTLDPEVHIHRIGRTARAGFSGLALNLVAQHEMEALIKVEQYQNASAAWHLVSELKSTSREPLLPAMKTLQILAGRKEKIRPGDVLGALTGVEGAAAHTVNQIGKIQVTDFCTFVAINREHAVAACAKLNAAKIKGKRMKVRLL